MNALRCEPVRAPSGDQLRGPDPCWPVPRQAGFLAHAIARDPSNLVRHVQRVRLWIDARNPPQAFAALLDLYIALGARGPALRRRMLHAAQALLAPECAQFLAAAHDAGVDRNGTHPPAPGSLLSAAERSERAPNGNPRAAEFDPAQEADACLRDGDVTSARVILESALSTSPERADLGNALLEIYVHGQDLHALRAMRTQLGHRLAGAAAWLDAEFRLIQAGVAP